MTVESATSKVSAAGNGSATVFSFSPIEVFETSDLVVVKTDADGVETTLTENTHYTVALSSSATPSTGSVTYPASGATRLATGETLTMKRVLPIEQTMDLNNQGGYFADTQEAAFDKLTMIALQNKESIDRSIKFPVSDSDAPSDLPTAANRALKFLAFDGDGQPIAAAGTSGDLGPVSSFINTLLDDADAATARATLGAAASFTAGAGLSLSGGVLAADPSYLRGCLAGLTLSPNATTPNTKVDISAGVCVDSTNAAFLKSAGTLTVDFGTTGANGLDTGLIAASKWYHIWLIGKADGAVAGFANRDDLTGLNPTLPSGYIYKRRLGSILADASGNIAKFFQSGDYFAWDASAIPLEFSGTAPTATTLRAINRVPPGVKVLAHLSAQIQAGTAVESNSLFIAPPGITTAYPAPFVGLTNASPGVGCTAGGTGFVATDTQQRIAWSASLARGATLMTMGYIDFRGKDL